MSTPSPYYSGKLADPKVRSDRAAKGGAGSHTPDAHIRALIKAAPSLTAEQRAKLAEVLAQPVPAAEDPGR
jgi:hypothetical protein